MKNSIKILLFLFVGLLPASIYASEVGSEKPQEGATEKVAEKADRVWDVTKNYVVHAWDATKAWTKQAWDKTKEGAQNLSSKFRNWWSSKSSTLSDKPVEQASSVPVSA